MRVWLRSVLTFVCKTAHGKLSNIMYCNSGMSRNYFIILFALLICAVLPSCVLGAPGDTTVTTFVNHPVDIDHRHAVGRFLLPHDLSHYKQILLIYTLSCPELGCDPWDRVSEINILQKDRTDIDSLIEIGRLVTPYGRG